MGEAEESLFFFCFLGFSMVLLVSSFFVVRLGVCFLCLSSFALANNIVDLFFFFFSRFWFCFFFVFVCPCLF